MQLNDLENERDILELNAYEEIAKRNAIIRELRTLMGQDLELDLESEYSKNLDNLHTILAKQTKTCLYIINQYQIVQNKINFFDYIKKAQ